MARYVTADDFRAWAYIEDGVDTMKIELLLESAEESVDNDLDYASLTDYVKEDGSLPAPLREAILIQAANDYTQPEDYTNGTVGTRGRYQQILKKYARLTPKS